METYKKLDEDSSYLKLPELDGAEYIVQMLNEAGTMSPTGMGVVPLSWQEIEAWMRVTQSKPALWERLMVRELSEAYVGEFHAASDKNRPEPFTYVAPDIVAQREKVNDKLLYALRSMKRRPAGEAD